MSTAIALPGGSVRLRLLLVPLALLTVIVLLLGPAPEGVYPARTVWVLALAASSTLLVLNGPAWLLAPPLLVEFAADDYFVPGLGVSGRLAAVVGVTLLLLPALVRRELRWGEPLYRVLLPALAFLVLATLGNLIHSNDEYVVKYLRYQTAQLLMLVVAALAPRGRHDLLVRHVAHRREQRVHVMCAGCRDDLRVVTGVARVMTGDRLDDGVLTTQRGVRRMCAHQRPRPPAGAAQRVRAGGDEDEATRPSGMTHLVAQKCVGAVRPTRQQRAVEAGVVHEPCEVVGHQVVGVASTLQHRRGATVTARGEHQHPMLPGQPLAQRA